MFYPKGAKVVGTEVPNPLTTGEIKYFFVNIHINIGNDIHISISKYTAIDIFIYIQFI